MYLKSIEVQGFKSFANKIRFEFHNGITGIVGPNGSGKSNVSDAVRWVFGEQSAKQLRGGSMQDVIFAGTQLRKPQSFALVKITLDNSDHALNIDYDEVSVTRKLYRSGESEYMLNDNPCRLKDINELFYDTGIGKEGYSIIGQGQIDKILSGKAEERRELFDEACGIVKYKRRKKETMKKLENERASMVRITDIVKELEKQTGPLARQSETAKQYLKLRDELKIYDLNAFLLDHRIMGGQLKGAEENLKIVTADLESKTAEDQALRQKYADLDDTIRDIDATLEDLRASLTEATQLRTALDGQINVVMEQINTEKNNVAHFDSRLKEIEDQIRQRGEKIEESKKNREDLTEELTALQKEAECTKDALQEADLKISLGRKQVEEHHGRLISLLNEKSEINARLTSLNTLITQQTLRKEELKNRIAEIDENGAALAEDCRKLDETYQKQAEELSDYEEDLEKAEQELKEAEANYADTQREINDLSQRYQIAKSRLETLKSMAERYEGFNGAVRRIMDVRGQYRGICGVVADLFKCDEKYTTAIETALGGSIQNIVVETEDTAKRLIRYLKDNRAGRATFLPLDNIRPSGSNFEKGVFSEPGIIGAADTLVSADEKYRSVIRYLLGRFLVFDTIDHALAASRKYRQSLRIVTLEGDLLSVGGSITGGAFKNTTNLLGRTKELDKLEKDAREAKGKIEVLNRRLNQFRQIRESTDVEIEDIEEDIRTVKIRMAETKAEKDGKNRSITSLALEKKESETRLSEVYRECKEAEIESRAITESIRDLENRGSENTDSEEETRKNLESMLQVREELQSKAESESLRLNTLEKNIEFESKTQESFAEEIENLREDIVRLRENTDHSDEILADYSDQVETLKLSYKDACEKEKELDERVRKYAEKRELLNADQHTFFDKRDELNSLISDLNRDQLRLQTQLEKLNERLDAQTEYLWTEYELTPSEAEQYRDESMNNAPQIRKQAQELKSRIKALGNVNINAIEQYKEVAERYEFMTGQYKDLCNAEASLVKIIEDLDDGMRRQFNENFAKIRVEYDRIFKELFGGGQGSIELEAGADVIDADITIISQPPGKKLQNMLQLSGGEKALSAIALIFAIHTLKPSPFCLLDEIEAALDESNVGRYAQYLNRLTDHTQFIVITHRRGTMVAADRLYGITMQEKGVSTLVSVNLVEEDLDK